MRCHHILLEWVAYKYIENQRGKERQRNRWRGKQGWRGREREGSGEGGKVRGESKKERDRKPTPN